jgi:hypothetical protein
MTAPYITWAIVMAILLTVAVFCWRENRRWQHDRRGDRLDHLIDDASARFSDSGLTHQNLAWPPEAEQPIDLVPADLPETLRLSCGCVHTYHGRRTSTRPCIVHNGRYWRQLERREGISP